MFSKMCLLSDVFSSPNIKLRQIIWNEIASNYIS